VQQAHPPWDEAVIVSRVHREGRRHLASPLLNTVPFAAFLVTVQFDDSVEFLLARSRSELLDAYPNNALIFHVAREMLGVRGVREITFGLESLEPVGPLDQFKFSMGFRKRPIRQRVVFHPVMRTLIRPRMLRTAVYRWADRFGTEGAFWRKTAGLVRFAEDGLR
jgi:hypothetical protein